MGSNTRTVSGSVNLYDDQKCIGNAEDKTIAAMLGGHSYNPINHREELYFPNLRHDSHFVDRSNVNGFPERWTVGSLSVRGGSSRWGQKTFLFGFIHTI